MILNFDLISQLKYLSKSLEDKVENSDTDNPSFLYQFETDRLVGYVATKIEYTEPLENYVSEPLQQFIIHNPEAAVVYDILDKLKIKAEKLGLSYFLEVYIEPNDEGKPEILIELKIREQEYSEILTIWERLMEVFEEPDIPPTDLVEIIVDSDD